MVDADKPTVWFVGAGPGDPDLITVKGRRLLERADAVLYAGSLVAEGALAWCRTECVVADSKGMALQEITDWLSAHAGVGKVVVRLQTGDPSLYGSLVEMVQPLDAVGIASRVVPGVSSAFASAAAAVESLTLPEVTQTVMFTRMEGRTPMPAGEQLADLARHGTTLCIFLSVTLLAQVQQALLAAGWHEEAPLLVVYKASWPGEEQIVRGRLGEDLVARCRAAGIKSQTMIIASPALGARGRVGLKKSKLYDAHFSHGFRRGVADDDQGKQT
ncbi:precorrin-4 C11-methyltransferase [Magnetococcus marinus MC-1]|uniref:Precorrin-4 C11-methyltransferase n=1 Tax=Magnetococcus marinus (strain ATCC BAA-1437 / JCM 17883 / MC-1) TaxID=156889 RepID=A0LCD3_MAGMM|nr:precorrin-4 C(11)-methyltransferase [Magnetococcus marinus]ABK45626.1 precorrin-4 C11-methyltransferase [Magnetococcus marinus MC-1]